MKSMAVMEIKRPTISPRMSGVAAMDDGEGMTFLCCKRDGQWRSVEKRFGGGWRENMGGGGGNREQR